MSSPLIVIYYSHPHPLELSNYEDALTAPSCSVCNLKASGWVFTCKNCNFFLHIHCSQAPPQIQNPITEKNESSVPEATTTSTEDEVRVTDADIVPLNNIDDHQYNDDDISTDDCMPLKKTKKDGDDADRDDVMKDVPIQETIISSEPIHSLDDSYVVHADQEKSYVVLGHTDNDVTEKENPVIEIGTDREVAEEIQMIAHGTNREDVVEELHM